MKICMQMFEEVYLHLPKRLKYLQPGTGKQIVIYTYNEVLLNLRILLTTNTQNKIQKCQNDHTK